MKKIFTLLKREYNERKSIKNILSEKERYLQTGKYKIKSIPIKKIVVYKENVNTSRFICSLEQHMVPRVRGNILKRKIKSFIQVIIKKNIELETKNENDFRGEVILISAENNKKIFDLNQNKVITFFNNGESYNKTKKSQKVFENFFTIPTIEYNDREKSITEKRIKVTPYLNWSDKDKEGLITDIFNSYFNYLQSLDKKDISFVTTRDILNESFSKIESNSIRDLLSKLIPQKYYNVAWPRVKSHGDLHLSNILVESGDYYYIDWESTKDYIFFHDILNLLTRSLYNYNTDELLEKFYRGKYDQFFTKLFSIFNLKYCKDDKLYYTGLYFIERIIVYRSDELTMNINPTLLSNQIQKVIDCYNFVHSNNTR